MKTRFLSLILFLLTISIIAQENDQTFLSLKDTGVEEFIKLHPEYDGRGTIILVLDTGVDMGIDGLTKTSTGEVKVIDAQDFTGQGDMPLVEANLTSKDGKDVFENEGKGFSVFADKNKMLKSADDNYWITVLNETHLMNSGSGAQDLNGNGVNDEKYYMVTYKTTEGYWVVYFDKDCNGDLSDETPIRNYKENYDAFTIQNQKGLTPLTFALNIFPDEKLISLYFDDGSHGTHCAGIAAGCNIGDAGINGVAPGANVIGIKLGNNNYPGGATVTESMKKAYLYADKISKEMKDAYKQPIIRADIEAIRGVAAGEMIRSLMAKGLVKIVGRAEILGRPMQYGTTKKFLETFGLNTLKDLPKNEELKKPDV